MSDSQSFQAAWRARVRRDVNGYRELATWNPFEGWETNDLIAQSATQELEAALVLRLGGSFGLSKRFLERALEIADRGLLEHLPTEQRALPRSKGQLLRIRSHAARGLDRRCPASELLLGSEAFSEWCADYSQADWDSQGEAYYLTSLRLALLAGDSARARSLLETNRPFRWHSEEHELLGSLAELEVLPCRDEDLVQRFRAHFDRIRNPDFQSDIFMETGLVRLELGLLWELCFVSTSGAIRWDRALGAIAD